MSTASLQHPPENELETETPETIDQKKRREYIQGLRDFADFLETTPGAPTPFPGNIFAYMYDRAKFIDAARAIGPFIKNPDDTYYKIEKPFGPFTYQINISRKEICTKRIETREVEVWDCPTILSQEDENDL